MERNLYVYIGIIVLEILMCFVTAVAASCVVYEVWKSIKERSLPGKKIRISRRDYVYSRDCLLDL